MYWCCTINCECLMPVLNLLLKSWQMCTQNVTDNSSANKPKKNYILYMKCWRNAHVQKKRTRKMNCIRYERGQYCSLQHLSHSLWCGKRTKKTKKANDKTCHKMSWLLQPVLAGVESLADWRKVAANHITGRYQRQQGGVWYPEMETSGW